MILCIWSNAFAFLNISQFMSLKCLYKVAAFYCQTASLRVQCDAGLWIAACLFGHPHSKFKIWINSSILAPCPFLTIKFKKSFISNKKTIGNFKKFLSKFLKEFTSERKRTKRPLGISETKNRRFYLVFVQNQLNVVCLRFSRNGIRNITHVFTSTVHALTLFCNFVRLV